MKRNYKNITLVAALALAGLTGCTGNLNVENINPQQTTTVNTDALLNKVYANLVLTGQKGPDGNCDITANDEGASNMIRQIWNANELTTDEAHCLWGDPGIPEYNHNSWSDAHSMLSDLYGRLFFGVTIANHFLEKATGSDAETLEKRAEARFLRALHYYYLLDMWGNVAIYTSVTSDPIEQSPREKVFAFIEKELLAIIGEGEGAGNEVLKDARKNTYGRADKAAAYMLLARLYLNAEVYTGTAQWAKAKKYADAAINSGYKLCTTGKNDYSAYQLLFMGDNDTNGAQNEIVLPVIHDGVTTQTWGGCLFLIASCNDGSYYTGTSEAWGGNRARYQFVSKFTTTDANIANLTDPAEVAKNIGDDRALFYPYDHSIQIDKESDFKSGYPYVKFLALHSDGTATKHTQFVDTDFPMLRLGEAYLISAEADARINGGECSSEGIERIKALRQRAHANADIAKFTLDQLCDEWSREMGFEGVRRNTLIRFGRYGGQNSYKWEWMGGTKNGTAFSASRNIFAIPSTVMNTGDMTQNPGY